MAPDHTAPPPDQVALKLYEACEKGNEAAVRRLARSIVSDLTIDASIDQRFRDGATALGATAMASIWI